MSDKCKACNVGTLDVATEKQLETCFDCIVLGFKREAATANSLRVMTEQNETLSDLMESNEAKVAKVQGFMNAEIEGVQASEKHLPEDQNPYPAGDERCVMWLSGWQSNETRRTTAQAISVLQWSKDNLSILEELMRGYGYGELANKTQLIREKLSNFVDK